MLEDVIVGVEKANNLVNDVPSKDLLRNECLVIKQDSYRLFNMKDKKIETFRKWLEDVDTWCIPADKENKLVVLKKSTYSEKIRTFFKKNICKVLKKNNLNKIS